VDAGSTGYLAIRRFVTDVVDTSVTRVYALVHIGGVGAATRLPRAMDNMDWEDPGLSAKAVMANRPATIGIKVHLSKERSSNPKDNELVFLKKGIEAGEATHLPVMVHINNTYNPPPVVFESTPKRRHFYTLFQCLSPG
jgi:predicted amidohydrolase